IARTTRAAGKPRSPGRRSTRMGQRRPTAARGAKARSPRAPRASLLPLHHRLRDLGDGLGGVEVLRAGLRAVQDGVAAVEAERILEVVEPLASGLVARIHDPALRLEQHRGAEIAVRIPPVAWALRAS